MDNETREKLREIEETIALAERDGDCMGRTAALRVIARHVRALLEAEEESGACPPHGPWLATPHGVDECQSCGEYFAPSEGPAPEPEPEEGSWVGPCSAYKSNGLLLNPVCLTCGHHKLDHEPAPPEPNEAQRTSPEAGERERLAETLSRLANWMQTSGAWDKQVKTLRRAADLLRTEPSGEPVAYTSEDNLRELGERGGIVAMAGERSDRYPVSLYVSRPTTPVEPEET